MIFLIIEEVEMQRLNMESRKRYLNWKGNVCTVNLRGLYYL